METFVMVFELILSVGLLVANEETGRSVTSGADQEVFFTTPEFQDKSQTNPDNDLVQSIQNRFAEIHPDSVPSDNYYGLVYDVNNAVRAGLITPIDSTYKVGANGIAMDIYREAKTKREIRLPSTKALDQARQYLGSVNNQQPLTYPPPAQQPFSPPYSAYAPSTTSTSTSVTAFSQSGLRLDIRQTQPHGITPQNKSYQNNTYPPDRSSYSQPKPSRHGQRHSSTAAPSPKPRISDYVCQTYVGFLNKGFSNNYMKNPVSDMSRDYIGISLVSGPTENYYILTLKVEDAVERGIIAPMIGTLVTNRFGLSTENYTVVADNDVYRLASRSAAPVAREYFMKKLNTECRQQSTQFSAPAKGTSAGDACYRPEVVSDFEKAMRRINPNSQPSEEYYELVLKVTRAVKCGILVKETGTSYSGSRGINTEMYRVVTDNREVRLVSVDDQNQATTYFQSKKTNVEYESGYHYSS